MPKFIQLQAKEFRSFLFSLGFGLGGSGVREPGEGVVTRKRGKRQAGGENGKKRLFHKMD